MIPKVIHYCWISGDPFPEKIQKCVDSWKKFLPGYEIVLWDFNKVQALHSRWCDEAVALKKYAFVADYVRFYALYHFGGIYLDSDVEVLKPFDDLLKLKYFVGKERNTRGGWEAAVIGAEKELEWVKQCLNHYRHKRFVNCYGEMRTLELPMIMRTVFEKRNYRIVDVKSTDEWFYENDTVCRFPDDWFSPKQWKTKEIAITPNTFSIHHFSASWISGPQLSPGLSLFNRLLRYSRRKLVKIKHLIFPKQCGPQ